MDVNEIMELSDSEKIKLYLSRYKTLDNAENRTITRKKTAKKSPTVEYKIVLSSGLDTVIERIEKENIKQLIIMPSQDKYLFKENDIIQDVLSAPAESLSLFFSHITDDGLLVNNIVFEKIYKRDCNSIFDMIKSYRDYLQEGLMSLNLYNSQIIHYLKKIDKKIWKMIVTKTPILQNTIKYDNTFVDIVNKFYEKRGYDATRMFVEYYTKSSMKKINTYGSFYNNYYRRNLDLNFLSMLELDTKRLIEYLCFDLYAQGFREIPASVYEDYIKMCFDYEDKVRDKYPEALLTAHDIISLKYNLHKKEIDEKKFMKMYERISNTFKAEKNVLFSYKNMSIVLPKYPNELIDEGQNLGHCVGSYINRVAQGECVIVFGRKNSDLESSYLTIELRPINDNGKLNYSIAQIQADLKRTKLTNEEISFFIKFMEKTGIKTSNTNFDIKYHY